MAIWPANSCVLPPTSIALQQVDTIPGSGRLWFTWTSSVDQDGGEHDVLQYILYRKLQGATTWADPLVVVRRVAGQGTYSQEISGNIVNTAYTFGISAQDCTPSESSITTLNVTPSP